MNPQLLLAQFDRISDAPDAMPLLRRFILDLAVRGKLVVQGPSGEPASVGRLDPKRSRKHAAQDSETEDSWPAELPRSWQWRRLGSISEQITDGEHATPPRIHEQQVPLVTAKNVRDGFMDYEDTAWVSFETANKAWTRCRPTVGDVLLVCVGATTGRLCVLRKARDMVLVRSVALIRPTSSINVDYLALALRSPMCQGQIWKKVKVTAQPCLYINRIHSLSIPLPPLTEQNDIVGKVGELMALCDRLEAAQEEQETRRHRLTVAAVHHLNNGAKAEEFRQRARFYLSHLPRLTTRPAQIPPVRQTILNLAVHGQLVRQDPGDEPASELLRRIQAEKERLIKEGKINREKPPIPARPDDLGFELSPGWEAARISQLLVELQTGPFGSTLHESDYQKGGVPVINPASMKNGRLIPIDSMAVGSATLERLATFKLRAGDIVMARRGEMGRCAVVTERENGWLCGTGSLILRLPDGLFPSFLVTLIGSPFVREYLSGSAVGATMQNLNQSILLNLVIGLPPLAEQCRIVAKVDELMALCDRLEAQLATAQSERRRLLDAILHEALNDNQTLDV